MPAERFPAIELVPKRETQLLDFLSSNEESDGRGIVIAVLDQGKMVHRRNFSERTMLHRPGIHAPEPVGPRTGWCGAVRRTAPRRTRKILKS